MLLNMMRQADGMFRANTQDIQGVCAQYGLLPVEAHALTVCDPAHLSLVPA